MRAARAKAERAWCVVGAYAAVDGTHTKVLAPPDRSDRVNVQYADGWRRSAATGSARFTELRQCIREDSEAAAARERTAEKLGLRREQPLRSSTARISLL